MKLLVDNQLPLILAEFLSHRGHDCLHVQAIGKGRSSDREIWRFACQSGRVLITKDDDFLLHQRIHPGTSILWVRLGNCRNHRLLTAFTDGWDQLESHLSAGQQLVILRESVTGR